MNYSQSEEWKAYMQLLEERPEIFKENENLKIELDPDKVGEFVEKTGKRIGVAYSSPYNFMVVDLVSNKPGNYFAYERLVPAAKGSAVVTVPSCNNTYVLLRQYRHALRDFQYAFPRGFGENGLTAEENACKEVAEEIGAKVLEMKKLGIVVADSGMSGNQVSVVACEVDQIKFQDGYEGIRGVKMLTEAEMEQWISEGKITDGFTLSAWALLKSAKSKSIDGK